MLFEKIEDSEEGGGDRAPKQGTSRARNPERRAISSNLRPVEREQSPCLSTNEEKQTAYQTAKKGRGEKFAHVGKERLGPAPRRQGAGSRKRPSP